MQKDRARASPFTEELTDMPLLDKCTEQRLLLALPNKLC